MRSLFSRLFDSVLVLLSGVVLGLALYPHVITPHTWSKKASLADYRPKGEYVSREQHDGILAICTEDNMNAYQQVTVLESHLENTSESLLECIVMLERCGDQLFKKQE